jgi:hypothetical protein
MNMTSQQAKPHPHLVRLLVKLMMNGAFLFSHLPKIPSQNAGSNVGIGSQTFLLNSIPVSLPLSNPSIHHEESCRLSLALLSTLFLPKRQVSLI